VEQALIVFAAAAVTALATGLGAVPFAFGRFRGDARGLDAGCTGLAPDDELVAADLQQQRFGTLGQLGAPARRQQRRELAAPPGEEARQRRTRKTRAQAGELIVEGVRQRHGGSGFCVK
jgi:hypothetical protein